MSVRSAQTSAMLVKASGRVPALSRMPSGMWQAAWDEWLQGWDSPRRRRRKTWRCPQKAERCSLYLRNASGIGFSRRRHSVTCAECRKLSAICMPSPVQEEFKQNSITSCGTAGDRGAAVAAHVRRARGRGVRGAGLDEYDGLARLSAADGRGSARYVPGRGVFFVLCI